MSSLLTERLGGRFSAYVLSFYRFPFTSRAFFFTSCPSRRILVSENRRLNDRCCLTCTVMRRCFVLCGHFQSYIVLPLGGLNDCLLSALHYYWRKSLGLFARNFVLSPFYVEALWIGFLQRRRTSSPNIWIALTPYQTSSIYAIISRNNCLNYAYPQDPISFSPAAS